MSGSVVTSGSAGGAGEICAEACAEEVAVTDIGFKGFAATDVAGSVGLRGRSFFTLSISGCLGTLMVDDGANDVGGVGRNSGVKSGTASAVGGVSPRGFASLPTVRPLSCTPAFC